MPSQENTFSGASNEHTLLLSESQRQITLMALAHLAVARPGWDLAIIEIAQKIDNPGPEMYNKFKAIKNGNDEFLRDEVIMTLQKPERETFDGPIPP